MHRSPFFGHRVEFVQHREYTAGDDIRHLDWKVWSKTDRFYIKQYEAETNLRCHARRGRQRVDALRPRRRSTSTNYACTVAACLAYLLLRQQDAVGLHHLRRRRAAGRPGPQRTRRTSTPSSRRWTSAEPRDKTDIEKILRRVAENVAEPRHDRPDLRPARATASRCSAAWKCCGIGRHDVLVFHILDDDELTFPFAGTTRFEGMEEMPTPAVRSARPARRLHRGPGRIPGRGAPRLRPQGHRLQLVRTKRIPRRRAVEVPAPPHGDVQGAGEIASAGVSDCYSFSVRSECRRAELRCESLNGEHWDLSSWMHSLFLNPGFLVVGGALISVPIIIHLINRMRFKRIRWAAMEFLLKAQKRNRRRLIIEQLLLLACAASWSSWSVCWSSRFVGCGETDLGGKPNLHIVLLDDTLSMQDQWKQDGQMTKLLRRRQERNPRQENRQGALGQQHQRPPDHPAPLQDQGSEFRPKEPHLRAP